MRTGEAATRRGHWIQYLLTARVGMSQVWLTPWLLVLRVPQHPLLLWALASSQHWREAMGKKGLHRVQRGGFFGSMGVWSPHGDAERSGILSSHTSPDLHTACMAQSELHSVSISVPDTPGSGTGSGRAGVKSTEDAYCKRPGSKSQLCH